MNVKLDLTADEVRRIIPYQLICETMCGSKWNTYRRKIMQKEWFTVSEINRLRSFRMTAERWTLREGVPKDGITVTVDTLNLWKKLGLFCSTL